MATIISGHNKSMTRTSRPQNEDERVCNCRNKGSCPLGNECLAENIIYEATVSSNPDEETRKYVGLCSTSFKDRLAVHKQHMNNRIHRKKCELANHIWNLKDAGKGFDITWRVLKKVRGRLVGGTCRLCTTEQLHIVDHPDRDCLLN